MYSDRTKKELLEILEQYQMLTFESQLSLNWELESRGLVVDKSALELAIEVKMSQINDLEYLNELGFNATRDNGGVTVTRTSNAIFADVIAVIFGVLVFLLGVYGVGSLVSLFVNGEEINVFSLAVNLAMAGLVLLGFKFLNGIQRLIDFTGFSLSNHAGTITLKKRFDLKLEEIKAKTSELFLESDEDELILKLGERTILNSNADNIVQRLTIERLTSVLKQG
ncbi:hypothetical protein ACFQZJ_14870 [Maribacter chungangensis]|uniref:Uncharacterized protein n=1 Tax=Maribacter chungangensis TaxID=1069117 RepID=A0ABW3B775_9FLAO